MTETDNNRRYPSPRSNQEFTKYWNIFIEDVASRPNFTESHLLQLEILCDLYAEYRLLREILEVTGYTYTTAGLNGPQQKSHPEVAQLNVCRGGIEKYTKLLGITLKRQDVTVDPEKKEEWR